MKPVRLLPVVIFAAIALLLFKGVGLVTTGGYVLTGTSVAIAAGEEGAPEAGATPTLVMPHEPTMEDTSPVLEDQAPTMPGSEEPVADSAEAATGHGETPDSAAAEEASEHAGAPPDAVADDAAGGEPSVPDPVTDAVPMTSDPNGNLEPLAATDGLSPSERQLLERLSQRRAELDAFDEELKLRETLVQAAEKRIEERSVALAALETRIKAMVEEKKAADDGQFSALVKMYEGMKPADAAAIFNALDVKVLVRLARGINPRKMAPIMAKMDEARAQDLTVRLANEQGQPPVELGAADLASLPQIVGQ